MKTAIQGLSYLCFLLLSVNTFAQTPDSSIPGCTDSEMYNFNSEATVDDGSCFPIIYGCMVNLPFICNFNPIASVDDNSCESSSCAGRATLRSFADAICVDPISENYFPLLDSITPSSEWATSYFNPDAANFQSAWVNQFYIDNSICDYIDGCTDQTAINYNPSATSDDDSCMPYVYGCIEIEYIEYNFNANVNDGSCFTPIVYGCTASSAFNYNDDANTDDGSCVAIDCEYYHCCGVYNNFLEDFCTSDLAVFCSYNCAEVVIGGCMNPTACNYSEEPILDDGSCTYPSAENLDCEGLCLTDTDGDGVCDEDEIDPECGDLYACNYMDLLVTTDIDDSLCTYPSAENLDCEGLCLTDTDGDGICDENEILGCTDITACNFNPQATEDDLSCEYAAEYYDCNGECISDYDGVCDELEISGCTDTSAFNYNDGSTSDDGSCTYITQYGSLYCGELLSIQDQISGGNPESELSNLPSYGAFSINIDSYNTIVEIHAEFENLESLNGGNYGYLIIFQNGDWFQSYYFDVNDWNSYSEIPNQIALSPGEYTFLYGPYSNSGWGQSLQDYTQSYTPYFNDDSFQIDLTLKMYDGSCYKEGCVDSIALNYNSAATSDDGSCTYITQYGSLYCGELLSIQDQISGGNPELELSNLPVYNAFSINIDSYNTTVEIQDEFELLENYNGYTSGNLIIFQNGDWFQSYYFDINDWNSYSVIPNQIALSPGEYTFVYGVSSSNIWGSSLEEYSQNYSPSNIYDSFQIDLTLTMYDGSCFNEGCTDPNALNYNLTATSDDGSCNYISELGGVNCGEAVSIQEQFYSNTHSGVNFVISSAVDSTYISLDFSESESGYFPEGFYVFKDGGLMEIGDWYSFPSYDYLILAPGEYTFIYGPNLCSYSHDLGEFLIDITNTSNFCWYEEMTDESMFDLTITMYDGSCSFEGCTDLTALNYNSYTTIEDSSCVYPLNIGELECGINNQFTGNTDRPDYFMFELIDSLDISFNFNSTSVSSPELYLYNNVGYLINNTSIQSSYTINLTPGVYYFILGNDYYLYEYQTYQTVLNFFSSENSYFNNNNNDDNNGLYTIDIFNYDGICDIYGCNDSTALNFNSNADVNDMSCIYSNPIDSLICGESYHFSDTLNESNNFGVISFEISQSTNIILECYIENDFTLNTSWGNTFGEKTASVMLFRNDTLLNEWQIFEDLYSSNMLLDINDELNVLPGLYTLIYLDNIDPIEFVLLSDLFNSIPIYEGEAVFNFDLTSFDGSCPISGCTDILAFNYDSIAVIDNMTCLYPTDLGILNCGQTVQKSTISSSFEDYLYSFEIESIAEVTFSCKSTYPPAITIYNDSLEIVDILYPEIIGTGSEFINQSTELNQGKYYIYINKCYSYDGIQFHEIDDQTSFSLDFHNLSILAYDGVCDLHGCTESHALNYNPTANLDDGSCIPYVNLGPLICGNNYEFDSDTISDIGDILSNSSCSELFSDLQQYSSISFTLDYPSIVNISSTGEAFDCDNNFSSGTTITSCLLLNDTVIHKYSWQFNINETTWGHNIFPLELGSGDYKFISYNSGWGAYLYPVVGLTNLELLNRIGISSPNNGFKYLINSNLLSYNGYCDYDGCMDSNAYNFSEYHTTNFIDDCDYTEKIFCGENQSIELTFNNEFGFIQSDFFQNEGIISFELENPTGVEINVNGGHYTLYKDNIFNLVAPSYIYGNSYNLDAGIYLVGVESDSDDVEVELNCLGCTDSDAFNYNSQAITENSTCCYPQVFYDCNGVCLNDFDVDLICDEHEIYGCTYPWSDNYDSSATNDDGSCIDLTNLIFNQTDSINSLVIDLNAIQQQLNSANSEIVNLNSTIELTSSNIIDLENQLEILLFNQEDGINQSNVDSIQALLDSANTTIYLLNNTLAVNSAIISELEDQLSIVIENPISIQLLDGWNMIGFSCIEGKDISNALSTIADVVLILKDNNGSVYLPEFGFNGIGDLTPGYGYQLKVSDYVLDFNICEE